MIDRSAGIGAGDGLALTVTRLRRWLCCRGRRGCAFVDLAEPQRIHAGANEQHRQCGAKLVDCDGQRPGPCAPRESPRPKSLSGRDQSCHVACLRPLSRMHAWPRLLARCSTIGQGWCIVAGTQPQKRWAAISRCPRKAQGNSDATSDRGRPISSRASAAAPSRSGATCTRSSRSSSVSRRPRRTTLPAPPSEWARR